MQPQNDAARGRVPFRTSLRTSRRAAALAALIAACGTAAAADWSDTSIGWRYGRKFAEPFGRNDIHKNVVDLQHASGYTYGTNFFNADLLLSDSKDPSSPGATSGAHEVYIVYRHTLDFEKLFKSPLKFGPARGFGLTFGFDANAKTDAGYNSKKRMLALGPTVFVDVPGFLNVSVLQLWESNAPYNGFTRVATPRYHYDPHPMLAAGWAIPIGDTGLSFEGYLNWIAAKGKDEFGAATKPETNFDAQVMYDVGALAGAKGRFKVGFEYQYWRNKFGNDHEGPAGPGAFAKTPMIRAEYHF